MLFNTILRNKSNAKAARMSGRNGKAMDSYRRVEYATEWQSGYRMRPVMPLAYDARLKYGI